MSKPLKDPCEVDGCDRLILARTYCGKHLQRFYKYGDPLYTKCLPPGLSLVEQLEWFGWRETSSGCWEWGGLRFGTGYGRFPRSGTSEGAHRVAFEAWVGPITNDQLVRHRCDNPPCINPAHLELGTWQDNMDDKVSRGRHLNVPRGDSHPTTKVTKAMTVQIQNEYSKGGVTMKQLGEKFGVSAQSICNAVHKQLDKGVVDMEAAA